MNKWETTTVMYGTCSSKKKRWKNLDFNENQSPNLFSGFLFTTASIAYITMVASHLFIHVVFTVIPLFSYFSCVMPQIMSLTFSHVLVQMMNI